MTADQFGIRVAGVSEVEQLVAVSVAARGAGGSDPTSAITDTNRLVVVAELDDAIVGWAKTHHYSEADGKAASGHYLGGVNVRPEFRRRGIGAALVGARLEWIFERSDDAWYFTNAANLASIALHERFGFTEAGRASAFHGTAFDGGEGILFRAAARRSPR